MAQKQSELTKRYFEKHGIRQKKFSLEPETLALFDDLAQKTGLSHTEILRRALREFADKAD